MPNLILIMTLLMSLFKISNGVVVYDCENPKFGRIYSLLDTQTCAHVIPVSITNTTQTYSVYQEAEFYRTEIKECRLKKATFDFYCGFHSHNSILEANLIPREIQVNTEDCESAFRTGKLIIDKDLSISVQTNQISREIVTRGRIDPDGYCSGKTEIRRGQEVNHVIKIEDYHAELLTYEVTFDIKTGSLLTRPSCNMKKGTCSTREATLIYKTNRGECDLRLLKRTVFNEITGKQPQPFRDEYVKIPKGFDKKRHMTRQADDKITSTVLITNDSTEMIRFIKKGNHYKMRCSSL